MYSTFNVWLTEASLFTAERKDVLRATCEYGWFWMQFKIHCKKKPQKISGRRYVLKDGQRLSIYLWFTLASIHTLSK